MQVLTANGVITLNRTNIVSIDRMDEGTRIMLLPLPYSEEPVIVESIDNYERVLESYFSG